MVAVVGGRRRERGVLVLLVYLQNLGHVGVPGAGHALRAQGALFM